MIKFENTVTPSPEQWAAIIRGMRNAYESWDKSDSYWTHMESANTDFTTKFEYFIGENDLALMKKLAAAGSDHRKFMRMIVVYADITAPMYWWKEYDTYKVGTVANSCSTMHTLANRDLTFEDFSTENLTEESWNALYSILKILNINRQAFRSHKDKAFWWQLITLLPQSYNQRRTVMLNYEVLANIYNARRGHKLDEWSDFRAWVEGLPYSDIITLKSSLRGSGDVSC